MPGRLSNLSLSHLAFLLMVAVTAVYLNWSAISASTKLYNLIVVVPVGITLIALIAGVIIKALRTDTEVLQQVPNCTPPLLTFCCSAFLQRFVLA
jgi:hypothetical protein